MDDKTYILPEFTGTVLSRGFIDLYKSSREVNAHVESVKTGEQRKQYADLVLALKWKHMDDRDRSIVNELDALEREIRGYV